MWPLLTVETEVNGDSKSTYEKGPSLVGSFGLSCRYKRFFFNLGLDALIGQYEIFFPRPTLPLSPSPSKLGRQPCWVACLLVSVSDVDSRFVHFKVTWGLYWFCYQSF